MATKLDPAVIDHLEWLGFVRPTGLVVSAAALVRAGAILERSDLEGQRRLESCIVKRPLVAGGDRVAVLPHFANFASEVLDWTFDSVGYAGIDGFPIPDELIVNLAEYGETLRPDLAIRGLESKAGDAPWQLLVRTLELGADLDRLRWGIDLARKTRQDAGLDPDSVAFGSYVNMGCHTDPEAARSLVRGGLTTFARFSVMHGKANGPVSSGDRAVLEALRSNYDMKAHTRGDSRQAGTLTDDFIDRFAIVGRPERCIERLKSLAALGLDKVAVSGASRGAAESDIAVGRRLVTMEVLPGLKAA